MNILILSIFSESKRNNEFLKIHRENLYKNECIDFYFITYNENLTEEIMLVDDILFIRGKEDLLNILDKTIKAMRYFTNIKQYDFIVRTNISTVLNYKLLNNYLNGIPKTNIYAGGLLFNLEWLDEPFGITEETTKKYKLNSLRFFQGTCIILSCDVAKFMLDNSEKFIREIIDDVSIGLFIKRYTHFYYNCLLDTNRVKYLVMPRDKHISDNIVAFRIKSFNDEEDIQLMNETYEKIIMVNQR